MSMMMPPDPSMGAPPPGGGAPPGMPLPPGGGGDIPPMDAMSSVPMPAEGGIEGLVAALQGGGGGMEGLGLPGGGAPGEEASPVDDMDAVDLIREAMKLLMVALAKDEDDERGVGITKGMGALQGLLGGEQKRQKVLADAGG
jgi:hypothetical protein